MNLSFIATVLNEEKTIDRFLQSINEQTVKPGEIVITDGGSSDKTVEKIKAFQKAHTLSFVLLQKIGNRSIGRNAAIEKAHGEIILCSDAGCVLDKEWVKNISQPFVDKKVDVVAGYYKGIATTPFQKCIIPYALVMPDKVNPHLFLPATRSMAFRKKVWKEVGEFPEQFSHNEDYVFANTLQKMHKNIIFAKQAVVYWYPPNNWKSTFVMFYRFAKGDTEARIIRPKVILLFLRYIFSLYLLSSFILFHDYFMFYILCFVFLLYLFWSITKNYRYVNNPRALYFLPLLQLVSDIAVLSGSARGISTNK